MESGRLRDMDVPSVFGYELDRETLTPIRKPLPPRIPGQDDGCDPLGDGTFRMVPSGDVVDYEERLQEIGAIQMKRRTRKHRQTYRLPTMSDALAHGCNLADRAWLPITVWAVLVDGFGYVLEAATAHHENARKADAPMVTALPVNYWR